MHGAERNNKDNSWTAGVQSPCTYWNVAILRTSRPEPAQPFHRHNKRSPALGPVKCDDQRANDDKHSEYDDQRGDRATVPIGDFVSVQLARVRLQRRAWQGGSRHGSHALAAKVKATQVHVRRSCASTVGPCLQTHFNVGCKDTGFTSNHSECDSRQR